MDLQLSVTTLAQGPDATPGGRERTEPAGTVLVVTEHQLLRSGLGVLLRNLGWHPVATASARVDLAIVDLCGRAPPLPHPPDGIPSLALVCEQDHLLPALLKIGYRGYLRADTSPRKMVKAFESVVRGEVWAERQVLQHTLQAPPVTTITDAERNVLRHLVRGGSNQAIASALGVSVSTVKSHLSSLFEKFGVDNRVQLALRFLQTRTLGEASERVHPSTDEKKPKG